MSTLELIVVMLGIPFFFIEISQLIQLVRSQKKLTSIWERILESPQYSGQVLQNFLFGFMESINNDPNKKATFQTFIDDMGLSILDKLQLGRLLERVAFDEVFFDILDSINNDPKKKEEFMLFMSNIGVNVVDNVRGYYEQHGTAIFDAAKDKAREKALKGVPKPIKSLVRVADYLGLKIDTGGKEAAKEVAQDGLEPVLINNSATSCYG